jgi:hypothetical protein
MLEIMIKLRYARYWPQHLPHAVSVDSGSIAERVRRLHKSGSADCVINSNSIPEPFNGNPEAASVILLSLNPGDGEEDRRAHADPEFRAAMLLNLKHQLTDHPFYPGRFSTPSWWQ